MCIFSQEVEHVAGTKIFARLQSDPANALSQYLVYSMNVSTRQDVAMILPLPVSSHAEDVVRFIALDGYPEFFEDIEKGFPKPERSDTLLLCKAVSAPALPRLVVHDVGSFIASFVPTLADFNRLDSRFRLPSDTWEQLPHYRDWGFAVFQLKGTAAGPAKVQKIHPMAFLFPTRFSDALYFPTMHIHDGKVHYLAEFDHALYFQGAPFHEFAYEISPKNAGTFMKVRKAKGIVQADAVCGKLEVGGTRYNRDILTSTHSMVENVEYPLCEGRWAFWNRLGLDIAALAIPVGRKPSKDVVDEFVELLAGIPESALPAFERAVQQESGGAGAWAKDALGLPEWKKEVWLGPLMKLAAEEEDNSVRIIALQSLGRLGSVAEPASKGVIEIALSEDTTPVNYAAEAAFDCIQASFQTAGPLLLRFLGHPERLVRHRAARILGKMGQRAEPAIGLLNEVAAKDEAEDVRQQALFAVKNITKQKS